MRTPRHFALIPAAGIGTRLEVERPKQYMLLAGKPMLLHILDTFVASQVIHHTYIVVRADDGYITNVLATEPHLAEHVSVIFDGGSTRHESVLNGLRALENHVTENDWVLVHDAARPGLTTALIEKLTISLQHDAVGGLLALPVVDTIKCADADSRVQLTVPRDSLWAAQTPQMFRYGLLRRALDQVTDSTDEASAMERFGLHPKLIEGNLRNFKVTLPHDVALAELFLKDNQ